MSSREHSSTGCFGSHITPSSVPKLRLMLGKQRGYLPVEGSDLSLSSEDLVTVDTPGSDDQWLHLVTRFAQVATVTVIICTAVDLLALLYFSIQLFSTASPEPGHWELRSSYINLDVLYSKGNVNSSQHGPIINHALSFVQVSLTEPNKVLPTYHTGFSMQQFGPVPLMEQRLLVTPQISTVAQFRAIDFGMESCSLAIGFPWLNETDISEQMAPMPTLTLDVYTLPIREKLNLHTVSYSSLPAVESLFAQLVLSEGTIIQTPRFPCRTLSYHTFLLTCSHPDCHLDVIRTTYDELGLFMYQYQTI